MNITRGALILGLALLGATSFATLGDFAVSTDSWNYNGTVTRFATLADAQNNVNSIGSGVMGNRDGGMFMGRNAPTSYMGAGNEDSNIMLTAWYYTTDTNNGEYSGWGNPNNQNDSFIQLYDLPGSTVTSRSGSWNSTFDTLTVNVLGSNAGAAESARMWPAAGGGQGGVFLDYSINYTVTGLSASLDPTTLWMMDDTNRGNLTGTFSGIFENTSVSTPGNNGFYRFNVNLFNSGSTFAEDNINDLNGAFAPPFFAAPVPEPASMAVLGLGALALMRRRKKS